MARRKLTLEDKRMIVDIVRDNIESIRKAAKQSDEDGNTLYIGTFTNPNEEIVDGSWLKELLFIVERGCNSNEVQKNKGGHSPVLQRGDSPVDLLGQDHDDEVQPVSATSVQEQKPLEEI